MYQWCLVFHLLFVISWLCGLFYLPRFFVYHAEALAAGSHEACAWFVRMERNLFRFTMIMLVLGVLFGIGLAYLGQWYRMSWFWLKMLCVILIFAYQWVCYRNMFQLAQGISTHTGRYYRIFNEWPVFLLLLILILAVMKPVW